MPIVLPSSVIVSPDNLRDQLRIAVRKKTIPSLEKAIEECEAAGYPELGSELSRAREALKSLNGERGGQCR